MFPKFHRLDWLKSRTFWQVAFCLILITAFKTVNKGTITEGNYLNNYLMNSERDVTPVENNK